MKYIVTESRYNKHDNTFGDYIKFTKIEQGSSNRFLVCTKFFAKIKEAIETDKTINRFEFKEDNLLQIEYLEDGELKEASFLFPDKEKNFHMIHHLRLLADIYRINWAEKNRKNVSKLLQEANDKKRLIKKIEKMLTQYAKTGTVVDTCTDKEATGVLEEIVTGGNNILRNMHIRLPMRVYIKMFSLLLLTMGLIGLAFMALRLISMNWFDVPKNIRGLYNFLNNGFWRFILIEIVSIAGAGVAGFSAIKIPSKWKTKFLNSFVVDYNKQHDFFLEDENKTEIKKVSDPFIRFIMKDIENIKDTKLEDVDDILRSYETLANEYIAARRSELTSGSSLDMYDFLHRLTELEVSVYSRYPQKGLQMTNTDYLRTVFFEDRLEYLDITEETKANDPYLKFVFEQAERIFSYPYKGCEAELAELYSIAADYVKESTTASRGLVHYTPSGKLLARETKIELLINSKIDTCRKYEQLADDVEKLEALQARIQTQTADLKTEAQTINLKPLEGKTQTGN